MDKWLIVIGINNLKFNWRNNEQSERLKPHFCP
ncbi:hypothetical protein [Pantoea phage Nafs113]|nr:hypothetical protein [Pantoea phage Nafs113]